MPMHLQLQALARNDWGSNEQLLYTITSSCQSKCYIE
jgi:hypothetical protein